MKELAFHSRRIRALLGVLTALTVAGGLATEAARGYPNPGTVAGSTVIHDPSMAIRPSAPRYVVFGTHNQTLLSNDRVTFSSGGPFLPTNPSWWQPYSNGDVWAPDVSFHNGQYITWNISGHVQLKFTNLAGANAVISGLFFS